MRIARLAPIWLPVPPQGYGGTERIVSYLTEGLVEAIEKLNILSIVEYEAMSKASRKRVEGQFSIEQMVGNYEKLYQHLHL